MTVIPCQHQRLPTPRGVSGKRGTAAAQRPKCGLRLWVRTLHTHPPSGFPVPVQNRGLYIVGGKKVTDSNNLNNRQALNSQFKTFNPTSQLNTGISSSKPDKSSSSLQRCHTFHLLDSSDFLLLVGTYSHTSLSHSHPLAPHYTNWTETSRGWGGGADHKHK